MRKSTEAVFFEILWIILIFNKQIHFNLTDIYFIIKMGNNDSLD